LLKTSPLLALLIIGVGFIYLATPIKRACAIQIFTPFGGKVDLWSPSAPGCTAITTAISVATLGAVTPTIEELDVSRGSEKETLGILRIDGSTIPELTTLYKNRMYITPGTNVVGNSINLCDICDKLKDVPLVGSICKVGIIKTVFDTVCSIVGNSCPINNLIHNMGTSLTPAGK